MCVCAEKHTVRTVYPANESCLSSVGAGVSLSSGANDVDPDGCLARDFGLSCDSISLNSSVASSNVFYREEGGEGREGKGIPQSYSLVPYPGDMVHAVLLLLLQW